MLFPRHVVRTSFRTILLSPHLGIGTTFLDGVMRHETSEQEKQQAVRDMGRYLPLQTSLIRVTARILIDYTSCAGLRFFRTVAMLAYSLPVSLFAFVSMTTWHLMPTRELRSNVSFAVMPSELSNFASLLLG